MEHATRGLVWEVAAEVVRTVIALWACWVFLYAYVTLCVWTVVCVCIRHVSVVVLCVFVVCGMNVE